MNDEILEQKASKKHKISISKENYLSEAPEKNSTIQSTDSIENPFSKQIMDKKPRNDDQNIGRVDKSSSSETINKTHKLNEVEELSQHENEIERKTLMSSTKNLKENQTKKKEKNSDAEMIGISTENSLSQVIEKKQEIKDIDQPQIEKEMNHSIENSVENQSRKKEKHSETDVEMIGITTENSLSQLIQKKQEILLLKKKGEGSAGI